MYSKYGNQLKNTWRKTVADYVKSSPIEMKSNPKALLRYAKNKLNFKNTISDLLDNGKIISDDNDKEKAFNMFFKSVFTKEPDRLPDFTLNVKCSVEHVFFLTDKIKKKLDNLKPYKSPRIDEVHPRVLKELSNKLSLLLSLIFFEIIQ